MTITDTDKTGINLGINNIPTHYVDIVIPSTDANNAINIANTFNGNPIFYVDSTGNCYMTGSLTCSKLVQTSSYGISLPTVYSSVPGSNQNMLGFVNALSSTTLFTLTSGVISNVNSISVGSGVYLIYGSVNLEATTSNSNVLRLSSMISTSSTVSDTNVVQSDMPIMNFSLGTSHSSMNHNISRIVSQTTDTTYYLNAMAVFTAGSVYVDSCKIVKLRIA